MPQPMEPEPTRLSALPSTSLPISRLARLQAGMLVSQLDTSINTPLRPQPARPIITARLLPRVSIKRLAYGRLNSVAKYCTLITSPAITVP